MWKTKLKEKWDEDPITCIVVASFAAVAVSKVIDSMGGYQSRRAYARQVEYKVAR